MHLAGFLQHWRVDIRGYYHAVRLFFAREKNLCPYYGAKILWDKRASFCIFSSRRESGAFYRACERGAPSSVERLPSSFDRVFCLPILEQETRFWTYDVVCHHSCGSYIVKLSITALRKEAYSRSSFNTQTQSQAIILSSFHPAIIFH